MAALDALWMELNRDQEPLRTLLLSGGSEASARLQLARAVCHRGERRPVALAHRERVNPQALAYLNRLRDLLFIFARAADSENGSRQRLWRPGATTAAHADERLFAEPDCTSAAVRSGSR